MLFSSYLEKRLTEQDFNTFTVQEKNALIAELASKANIAFTEVTPEFILNHHKQLKVSLLSEKCEETILKGFVSTTTGHHYRTNRDDQVYFIGRYIQLLQNPQIDTVMWRAEDLGVWVPHSRDEWMSVYNEAMDHVESTLIKYNQKKQLVLSAETHADVLNITWDN